MKSSLENVDVVRMDVDLTKISESLVNGSIGFVARRSTEIQTHRTFCRFPIDSMTYSSWLSLFARAACQSNATSSSGSMGVPSSTVPFHV